MCYSVLSSTGKDNKFDHLLSSIQTPKTKETLVELAKHQLQGKINFKQVVCKETVLVDGVAE